MRVLWVYLVWNVAAMSSMAPEGFFGACTFHEMSPLLGTAVQLPTQLRPGFGPLSTGELL
jgi:hypothetical protein